MATETAAPACRVIRAHDALRSKQDLSYVPAVSAQSAGTRGLCMQRVTIPPGGRAKPHLHANHETAIYVLSGAAARWWGEGLRERLEGAAGDFFYIPANVPHLPVNLSQTEPCVAIIARTDPNEQERVVLLPHLDAAAARLTA
jgi:uncharacterized RmlC-like cupin family protein